MGPKRDSSLENQVRAGKAIDEWKVDADPSLTMSSFRAEIAQHLDKHKGNPRGPTVRSPQAVLSRQGRATQFPRYVAEVHADLPDEVPEAVGSPKGRSVHGVLLHALPPHRLLFPEQYAWVDIAIKVPPAGS